MKIVKMLVVALFVFVASKGYAEVISLQNYLKLVANNNADLKAVQANIDATKGKIAELERAYTYYLSAGGNYLSDESGQSADKLTKTEYELNVNKEFVTGTKVELGFKGSQSELNWQDKDNAKTVAATPYIKVDQSLLKNFNGGATKAGIQRDRAKLNAALYEYEFKKQSILLDAKMAYWRLSYARTVIDFRNASLQRSQKIYEWNNKRYKSDLADRTDLLQSQAAMKLGELYLKVAYEDEAKYNRTFNQFINLDDNRVKYDVEKFDVIGKAYAQGKRMEKRSSRLDVAAALESVKSAEFNQKSSIKSLGSDLVLSGQYTSNGIDSEFGEAFKQVSKMDKPSYTVGLRFTVPLDFGLRKVINQGYNSAIIAAKQSADSLVLQEKNDWAQLVDDWRNTIARLALVTEIEEVQSSRSKENHSLLERGRTTTAQVIQSEEDLDAATLRVFETILSLIGTYEQSVAFYGVN